MSAETAAVGYEALYLDIVQGKTEPMVIPSENLVRIIKLEKIRPQNPELDGALDFGCGDGRHAKYLNELGYRVLATDVTQGAVDATKLRMTGKPVETAVLSLEGSRIPAEDSSMSLVLGWEVLHWVGSKELFVHYLKEFARVIQKQRQGHFILTMPTEYHYMKLQALEVGESLYRCQTTEREDFVMYSPNLVTLKAMLRDHGFEVKRVKSYSLSDDSEEWGGLHHQFAQYSLHCVHP